MSKETFNYTNDEVTVVWKPNACIHSGICWKGLISVFNPKNRPWINIKGSDTMQIIEQVKKCPSGALSYFMNEGAADKKEESKMETSSVSVRVEVTPNGPLILKTDCIIVHPDGREEVKAGKIVLCRCGSSGNKPYCDGSHKKSGFSG